MRSVSRLPSIGIDVGASKIVAGVVDEEGDILHRYERRRTPDSSSAGLVDAVNEAIWALLALEPEVCAVGVGVAGLVTWPDGEIEYAANHTHDKLKLRRRLVAKLGPKAVVVVENDANAAAWAEFRCGSIAPDRSLLFITIGTGLGSGFVWNEELVRGPGGRGAEIGHLMVDRKSTVECGCGARGCLEAFVSGIALEREGRARMAAAPNGLLSERFRHRPIQATTRTMITAACEGEPEAVAIVDRMGFVLGRAIGENVMSLFPPDEVVIGGGLARLEGRLLPAMRNGCKDALSRSRCYELPEFTASQLRVDAVFVGAALRAGEDATKCGSETTTLDPPVATRPRSVAKILTSASAP